MAPQTVLFRPRNKIAEDYLFAYNAFSAFLWFSILIRIFVIGFLLDIDSVPEGTGDFLKWVQTLAILEIFHSAFKIVKSPINTAIMQVSSRLLLTWGIIHLFPWVSSWNPVIYCAMVLSWSVTEIIRYSYYAFNIIKSPSRPIPKILIFLRYSTFYILYPLGILSEVSLIIIALPSAYELDSWYSIFLKVILVIYIPGSYILFTHMVRQRRKVLKSQSKLRSY